MKIIYSPESLDDLINIYSYISSVLLEPEIAENQVNRIRKTIRKLDQMPMRHRIVDWEPWILSGGFGSRCSSDSQNFLQWARC